MKGEHYLPFGDILKMFLLNANMPKADLKEVLRKRGVFFSEESKENLVSFLSRSAIAPTEFDTLKESIRTREENPKVRTQSIAASETEENLLETLSETFDFRSVVDHTSPFSNYKLIGTPKPTPVKDNLDNIEYEFTIERKDLTKSWDQRTERFDGKLNIKKVGGEIGIIITQTHTSSETREVAERAAKGVIKTLQVKNFISNDAIISKIKFSDFSNINRIIFFKKLLQDRTNKDLSFADLTHVGMRPAEDLEFPDDIDWMSNQFKSIDFRGDKMHSIKFLKQENLHQFIELYSMQALMSFEYADSKGECEILCEFPDLIAKRRRDAELILSVDKINIAEKDDGVKLFKIKERILEVMNKTKILEYKNLATTNT